MVRAASCRGSWRRESTAAGVANKYVYAVDISVVGPAGREILSLHDVEVREMPVISDQFKVLVGWSILQHGVFTLSGGPLPTFSLRFGPGC
jgi:hypothetical protein